MNMQVCECRQLFAVLISILLDKYNPICIVGMYLLISTNISYALKVLCSWYYAIIWRYCENICYFTQLYKKKKKRQLCDRCFTRNTQNKKQGEILDPHLKYDIHVQSNDSISFLTKHVNRVTMSICLFFFGSFVLVSAPTFPDTS